MLRQVLYAHWKIARWALLILVPLALGLPLLAMQVTRALSIPAGDLYVSMALLEALQVWMPVFPVLAAVVGATIALTAWTWDHNANHVYALTLPLPRWEYALLKLAAGVLLLLVPVLALFLGALIATGSIEIPVGLEAYPVAFTLRFLTAALLAYGVSFALAAGTIRTAIYVIVGAVLAVIFGSIAVEFLKAAGFESVWSPLDVLYRALLLWPGPFHVFGGNWMLIDV